MKYHLTGFGVSTVLHVGVLLASLPLLLWQDKLGQVTEPQPVQLSLAQFIPAPPPQPVAATPVIPQAKPEPPQPEPKPKPPALEKPKPEPKPAKKPLEKPKPEPKPTPAPKPKPVEKTEPTPEPKPQPPQPDVEPKPAPVARAEPVAPKPQAPPVPARPATPRPVAAPAPQAAPAQATNNKAAEATYKAKLQNLIAARKQYPRMAEKAEVEGSVVVAFTVMPNGTITGARVSQSSGNEWLDKAAVQAVNATSGALPFPPEIRKAQWAFSLTVNFTLD